MKGSLASLLNGSPWVKFPFLVHNRSRAGGEDAIMPCPPASPLISDCGQRIPPKGAMHMVDILRSACPIRSFFQFTDWYSAFSISRLWSSWVWVKPYSLLPCGVKQKFRIWKLTDLIQSFLWLPSSYESYAAQVKTPPNFSSPNSLFKKCNSQKWKHA